MNEELEKENAIISEFLRSIGPWSNHIVIGGGYALVIYKLYLSGYDNGSQPVRTTDLDSLIPRKIPDTSIKSIANYLYESGFKQIYKDYENPATEAYVKEIGGEEVEIEFLTDALTRGNKNENVEISGVVAQSLSYLSLSLQTKINFKTHSGEKGNVVSPGAWLFHKGLTFPRRNNPMKVYKDLYGIWYVASQLGDFSNNGIKELKMLFEKNQKWAKTFKKNLSEWVEEATPQDWSRLEIQDPSNGLKKIVLKKTIQQIIE